MIRPRERRLEVVHYGRKARLARRAPHQFAADDVDAPGARLAVAAHLLRDLIRLGRRPQSLHRAVELRGKFGIARAGRKGERAWLVSHIKTSVKSGDTCTIGPQAAGVERAQHPLARVLVIDQYITAPFLAVGIGRCYVYRMTAAAYYRLELKAVGRSSGRQICAAAAYGSRSTIHDLRQNRTFTFSNRRDLIHSEIIAPENAPDWTRDRASLWNRVESGERRKDATTGRELTLSLPRGLNDAQKIAAVRAFAWRELLHRGLVADVSIHRARATDGSGEQDHAHVLIPTRSLDGDAFASKKLPWLGNPTKATEEMQALRAAWADVLNETLEAAGIDRRVSHLSRDAQRAQAAAVAADETRDLTARTTAAVEAIALAEPAESKIGYRVVAQARREIEKAARATGEVIELAPYLAARSPAAAKVYAQRAERAALAAELAPSIWRAADQAAAEATARAQADAAAAEARRQAEAEAAERLAKWKSQADAATARLRADPRKREEVRQRFGIEIVPGDVRDQWAIAQSRAQIEGFQSRFTERGLPRPSGLVVPAAAPLTSLLAACLRVLTAGARKILTLVLPEARKAEDALFRRFAAVAFPTATSAPSDWARYVEPPKPEPPPAPEPDLPDVD